MTLRILGIETSCDETAAAVVEDGHVVLSNVVASQAEFHAQYGGVYPEMASRMHLEVIASVVEEALWAAHLGWGDLDAIAVTYGPGLPGSLLVGLNFAKGAALVEDLPLVPVNHLEGHFYAHWLDIASEGRPSDHLRFPLLALIVSGGHTELVLATDHGQYERLGSTRDDAAGEAFDKVARMLKLGYPGGPAIEEAARAGDPAVFNLPRAWLSDSYDFSFSGLKTAVLRTLQKYSGSVPPQFSNNMAAAFQESVVDVLVGKTARAAREYAVRAVLLSGGVSANTRLRERAQAEIPAPVYTLPKILCTDNAAMIAAAGYFRYQVGDQAGWDLDIDPGLQLR